MLKFHNGITYRALFLVAYFGFFRLASLVPNTVKTFDKIRFPVFVDVIWGPLCVHVILSCVKNMHKSGDYQVVQLPKLNNQIICPVTALKTLISKFKYDKDIPLFLVEHRTGVHTAVAPKVRLFLKLVIVSLG